MSRLHPWLANLAKRCLLILAGFTCACLIAGGAGRTYTLAVIPSLPPVALHKAWTPLVRDLSRETGLDLELKLYGTFPEFLADCEAGVPDFIYISPNLYYLVHEKQKYLPLVRSSVAISGLVFVRRDSPCQKVRDLHGRTIAFVGPKNVCSVITRYALASGEGDIDYNASFSGSTINVAKSVLLGKADAGAILDAKQAGDFVERSPDFRVLLRTPKIAPHPLAAHPRVPKDVREAVNRAVFALAATESGRALLEGVGLGQPTGADFQRDYALFGDPGYQRIQRP
ncbi:MAG TPA: phosphate/phosphite/phosphonate ABC transporter substrate-binding protein [Holophagaceae bacterium]